MFSCQAFEILPDWPWVLDNFKFIIPGDLVFIYGKTNRKPDNLRVEL